MKTKNKNEDNLKYITFDRLPKKGFVIVNRENEYAISLMKKMGSEAKDGALIPVTQEEFDALKNNMIFVKPFYDTSDLYDMLMKIEKLLGINPQGNEKSVSDRLKYCENEIDLIKITLAKMYLVIENEFKCEIK